MSPKLLTIVFLALFGSIKGQNPINVDLADGVPEPPSPIDLASLPSPDQLAMEPQNKAVDNARKEIAANVARTQEAAAQASQNLDAELALQNLVVNNARQEIAADIARNEIAAQNAREVLAADFARKNIAVENALNAIEAAEDMARQNTGIAAERAARMLQQENAVRQQQQQAIAQEMARTNFPAPAQMLPTGTTMTGTMPISTSTSGVPQPDGQISVGNIQVIYNDQLRQIMRDYDITPEEIRRMLEMYARGGSATISKERTNPNTGLQETITLDFENFTTKSPGGGGSIPSVSPTAGPLPGTGSRPPISSGTGSGTSQAKQQMDDLLSTEKYLRDQIRELDAQYQALNAAFLQGVITQLTRDENAVINRENRRKYVADLQAIQQEIERISGSARKNVPRVAAQRPDITQIERENEQIRQQILRTMGGGTTGPTRAPLGQTDLGLPRTQGPFNQLPVGRPGRQLPIGQQLGGSFMDGQRRLRQGMDGLLGGPRPLGQLPRQSPQALATLRQELDGIRLREQIILNRLRQLRSRFPQMRTNRMNPFERNLMRERNLLQEHLRRSRVNFIPNNRPQQRTRTLTGSVSGQNMLTRRTM